MKDISLKISKTEMELLEDGNYIFRVWFFDEKGKEMYSSFKTDKVD